MTKKTSFSQAKGFVQHERKKGMRDEVIMRSLLNAGWKAKDITEALNNPKLPEHIVKRNQSRYHLAFSQTVKDIPLNAWIIMLLSALWIILFFKGNGTFLLFITFVPIIIIFLGLLFLYDHYKKEWMLNGCIMLAAGLFALALFTLYTWLISFLWRPMAEQWLLMSLYPGMVLTFFAQEFAYHYWLGVHEKHTLKARIRRAISYSLTTLLLTFVTLAITGMLFVSSLQDMQFRAQENFAQLEEQITLSPEEGVLPVYQETMTELREMQPTKPDRIPAGIEGLGKILTFQDMSPHISTVITYTTTTARYKIAAGLSIGMLSQAFQQEKVMRQNDDYYDNSSSEEEHLTLLLEGNARLKEALNTLPELEEQEILPEQSSIQLFRMCTEGDVISVPKSISESTMQRLKCSSKSIIALVNEISAFGKEVTMTRKAYLSPERWSVVVDEPVKSAIIRHEVERQLLQKELEQRLGLLDKSYNVKRVKEERYQQEEIPGAEQISFAKEHQDDPYFGPITCLFLTSDEQTTCASKWAPLYRDRELCIHAKNETDCRATIINEEIAVS